MFPSRSRANHARPTMSYWHNQFADEEHIEAGRLSFAYVNVLQLSGVQKPHNEAGPLCKADLASKAFVRISRNCEAMFLR